MMFVKFFPNSFTILCYKKYFSYFSLRFPVNLSLGGQSVAIPLISVNRTIIGCLVEVHDELPSCGGAGGGNGGGNNSQESKLCTNYFHGLIDCLGRVAHPSLPSPSSRTTSLFLEP